MSADAYLLLFAAPFLVLALLCSIAALTARPLFATCMGVLAAGAAASAFLALRGRSEAALALVVFTVAWAPLLFLGAILLSKRAVRPRRLMPWGSFFAALVLALALGWVGVADGPTPAASHDSSAHAGGLALWLAPVTIAGVFGCVALLGFGERGALGAPGEQP